MRTLIVKNGIKFGKGRITELNPYNPKNLKFQSRGTTLVMNFFLLDCLKIPKIWMLGYWSIPV